MAKREVLGLVDCPECGMSGAEVKAQKNGLAYRWCPECNAQYFPRTEEASARLLAKVGASVQVSDTGAAEVPRPAAKVAPVPIPVSERKPVAEQGSELPKKRGTGNPFLDLVNGVTA